MLTRSEQERFNVLLKKDCSFAEYLKFKKLKRKRDQKPRSRATSIICLLSLALFVCGCNIPGDHLIRGGDKLPRQLDIKLDGIIGINSQIGSVIGYNLQRVNPPLLIDPPSTQAAWMIWHVQNIKLGKRGR